MNEIAVNYMTFTYCTYFYLNFAPRFEKTDQVNQFNICAKVWLETVTLVTHLVFTVFQSVMFLTATENKKKESSCTFKPP